MAFVAYALLDQTPFKSYSFFSINKNKKEQMKKVLLKNNIFTKRHGYPVVLDLFDSLIHINSLLFDERILEVIRGTAQHTLSDEA